TLREITIKLQLRDIDIRYAYSLVASVKNEINLLSTEVDDYYDLWYTEIKELADKIGTDETMRRVPKANIYRATHPAENPKIDFKRAIVIPFINEVKQQLSERFSESSVMAVQAFMSLMPLVIGQVKVKEIPDIVDQLSVYKPDVPRFQSLQNELQNWRGRWITCEEQPKTMIDALKSCSKHQYP
ncbi:unnamed protein product, partial [Meganyctiphanes norvegica]